MEDLIYDQFKGSDNKEIGWATAKNWGLGISRKEFHKHCDNMVKEFNMTKIKVSGFYLYKLT